MNEAKAPLSLHPFCRDDLAHENSGIAGACKGWSTASRMTLDARWVPVPCDCVCHLEPGEVPVVVAPREERHQ